MTDKPKLTFEDLLINYHADHCVGVLDDDMPDDYDNFIKNLDHEDIMKFAQNYGNIVYLEGIATGLKRANSIYKEVMR